MLRKVSLETMVWKYLVFKIQGVKIINDIIIFQMGVLIFPNMSIYVPWIWCRSKFSWNSDVLFSDGGHILQFHLLHTYGCFETKNGPRYKFAFLKVSYTYFLCLQRFKHFCLHPRLTVPCMLLKLFCTWESCLPCLFVRTWEIEKVFCQIRFSTVLKWYCKAESIATQCGGHVYRRSSICHHQ